MKGKPRFSLEVIQGRDEVAVIVDGWIRGVYPSMEVALEALRRDWERVRRLRRRKTPSPR
ncbi:hypothetical protein TSC_c16670 [Thermus scotoductus SA-01]|jgi:hypothetical protein|uniref:Uncharacterized protein n=1 Tax=Thermus scotoductus (strain ATCC 700910 / SA-01) TaxID=743525 RepID=E8PL58_THESS|nr:hypothetical protein TSC_c16670 [Thermus scotoductus SA-01]